MWFGILNTHEYTIYVGNIRWSFHMLLNSFYLYVYIWLCDITWWFAWYFLIEFRFCVHVILENLYVSWVVVWKFVYILYVFC